MSGWVYIITNQAMPGIVKVGFTERHPSERAGDFNQQHYRTAIPFPFVVAYAARVEHPRWLERETHKALDHYRVTKRTKNRKDEKEWFRCSVGEATTAIRQTASRFQWLIGSVQEEIGPFETEAEIEHPFPEPPPAIIVPPSTPLLLFRLKVFAKQPKPVLPPKPPKPPKPASLPKPTPISLKGKIIAGSMVASMSYGLWTVVLFPLVGIGDELFRLFTNTDRIVRMVAVLGLLPAAYCTWRYLLWLDRSRNR